jgi:hypothetical protein
MGDEERAKHARDLNCLVDEDRGKRRRALDTFATLAPTLPPAFVVGDLLPPVLRAVGDAVEKNRELAVGLLSKLCAHHAAAVPDVARAALPVVASRVGSLPFPEGTEEIRLLLVQLVHTFLKHPACGPVVADNFTAVVEVLVRSATDAFHDVKVRTAGCTHLFGYCRAFCRTSQGLYVREGGGWAPGLGVGHVRVRCQQPRN